MKIFMIFVIAGFLVFSGRNASAQCPAGIPSAGNPQCVPPSAWPQNTAATQPAGPAWKLTWGAIAIDPDHGDVGTSVGQFSKRNAEREALVRCAEKGAKGCKKILFTYQNQCAAVAWPSVLGHNAVIKAASGPTIESASEYAMKLYAVPTELAGVGLFIRGALTRCLSVGNRQQTSSQSRGAKSRGLYVDAASIWT
ncbi:DUF4189 domain-containing protein [Lysobacter antibioticus]|uniref:DUF4189 domain-containing protein n=1 Tax=Lysobacter antibioticus TaxID=84531 RepID=UPI0009E800A6|nr:DUF4189 domain-containing protein [Lysobacter antibioticus]